METQICDCEGIMWHSADMENPCGAVDKEVPFYQCEQCGEIIEINKEIQ